MVLFSQEEKQPVLFSWPPLKTKIRPEKNVYHNLKSVVQGRTKCFSANCNKLNGSYDTDANDANKTIL